MVKSLEISATLINQIKKYEGKHKVIDDLLRVPGMNFLMPMLHHLIKGAQGLDKEVILGLEQALF